MPNMNIIFLCVCITTAAASRNHHHFLGLNVDTANAALGLSQDNNGFYTIIHNGESNVGDEAAHATFGADLSNGLPQSTNSQEATENSDADLSENMVDLNRAPEPVTDTPEVEMARQAHFEAYREAALMAALAPDNDEAAATATSLESDSNLDQLDELQQNTRKLLLNKQKLRKQLLMEQERGRSADLERIAHELGQQQQRQLVTTYILTAKAEAHALSSGPQTSKGTNLGDLQLLAQGERNGNIIRNEYGNGNGNGNGNGKGHINGNGYSIGNGLGSGNGNGQSNGNSNENNGNRQSNGGINGNGLNNGNAHANGNGLGNGHSNTINNGIRIDNSIGNRNGNANRNGNGNDSAAGNDNRNENANGRKHGNGNRYANGNGNGHSNGNRLDNANGNGHSYGIDNAYRKDQSNGRISSALDEPDSDTTYYTVDTPDTHYTVVIPPPSTVLTTFPRIDSIRLGEHGGEPSAKALSKSFTYRTQRIKTKHS
uniref:Uncharacterized protein n=1 Tax=Stomoxys calcitrans TaxID=35570 RepID=A0A1I8PN78_STOCA